jgi:hypothetical protein
VPILRKDDAYGAKVVVVVGLKILVCLATADGGVFYLSACSVGGTSS